MSLPLDFPYPPMEAEIAVSLPQGPGWSFEPKWTACRYFPDVLAALAALPARRFVLDGEIVVPVDGRLSFDALLLRVHPAESRVRSLAEAHPAGLIVEPGFTGKAPGAPSRWSTERSAAWVPQCTMDQLRSREANRC